MLRRQVLLVGEIAATADGRALFSQPSWHGFGSGAVRMP